MPKECADCGKNCIKTKGSYQEYCPECLEGKATDTRHVLQCSKYPCDVCIDKLEEIQSVIQPLFVWTLLQPDRAANTTLEMYQ